MSDTNPLKIGANLTNLRRQLPLLKQWHGNGTIDYIEILLDNFSTIDPLSLREALGDIPVGLHIMNSKFLDRAAADLPAVAGLISNWISAFAPIYVSDHVMRFSMNGFSLPYAVEEDYKRLEAIASKIDFYQDLLKQKIHFENFPSMAPSGKGQAECLCNVVAKTGCGILFDVSNAEVAELNGGDPWADWQEVAKEAAHFHVAGFGHADRFGCHHDSHDSPPSGRSMSLARSVIALAQSAAAPTVTIEYDHNVDSDQWAAALEALRRRTEGDQ